MRAPGPDPRRLACSVRACARPLELDAGRLICAGGHAFDLGRGGWVNLLQPQDRRSLAAGDSSAAVEARLRLAERGADRELWSRIGAWLVGLELGPEPGLLEVGCGPGVLLAALCAAGPLTAHGLDLSAPAIRRAARNPCAATWIVANAERRLPFQDGALDVLLSLRGPKQPAEFARVLRPGGHLLLGVPGPDDLAELRRATAGAALPRDPAERALEAFGVLFERVQSCEVRAQLALDREGLADLLTTVYRGARRSEAERLRELGSLELTQSTVLLHLVPRAAP